MGFAELLGKLRFALEADSQGAPSKLGEREHLVCDLEHGGFGAKGKVSSDPRNERQYPRRTAGRIRGMMTDMAGHPIVGAFAREKGQQSGDDALVPRHRTR